MRGTHAWTRRQWLAGVAAGGFAVQAGAQEAPARAGASRLDWPVLRLVDGSTVAPEYWAGMPAIVVFWATWCAFCKRHNAHVDRLSRSLAGSGPRVLGVAIDGDAATVTRYMRANGYRFPVVVDGGSLRPLFTSRRVIPMTCLVDRRGQVLQCIPGEMTESDVLGLPRSFVAIGG